MNGFRILFYNICQNTGMSAVVMNKKIIYRQNPLFDNDFYKDTIKQNNPEASIHYVEFTDSICDYPLEAIFFFCFFCAK